MLSLRAGSADVLFSPFWATPTFDRLLRRLGLRATRRRPTAIEAEAHETEADGDRTLQRSRALLKQVLGRHPQARKVFPHLAMLERALRGGSEGALQRLSPAVVERACSQLASVASEDDTAALDLLLRRTGHATAADLLRSEELPDDFSLSRFSPEVSECDPALLHAWAATMIQEEGGASVHLRR